MVGRKRVLIVATIAVFGVMVVAGPALAAMLTAALTGAAEVPGPGDPDGTGQAEIKTIPKKEKVCFELTVSNVDQVTLAHIHKGSATQAGDIVKALRAPVDGSSSGCVKMGRKQIMMINRNPSAFYVNVHSEEHSGGAVKGQLVVSP